MGTRCMPKKNVYRIVREDGKHKCVRDIFKLEDCPVSSGGALCNGEGVGWSSEVNNK